MTNEWNPPDSEAPAGGHEVGGGGGASGPPPVTPPPTTPPSGSPPPPPGQHPGAPPAVPPAAPDTTGVGGPPTVPPPVTPTPPGGPERSRRRLAGVLVSVVALLAAGVFAIVWITGGSSSDVGAQTPDELGDRLLDVVADADVLGGIDLLLPGERTTFRQPAIDLVDELERLEVLSDLDLSAVPGVDVEVTERSVEVEETEADDIVHITVSGIAAVDVFPGDLPIGDLVDGYIDDLDEIEPESSEEPFEFQVTGVEQDGDWYVSLWYTAAEALRATTYDPETGGPLPIPAERVEPVGGETPEGAIEVLIDAVNDLDLEAMIAALNPDEAAALQRYAPLFLDEASEELEVAADEVDFEISGLETRVEGSGDRREVHIDAITASATYVDEWSGEEASFEIDWADGCFVFTVDLDGSSESIDTCDLESSLGYDADSLMDEFFGELPDPDAAQRFFDTVEDAFDDYELPGITVARVDGQWFVSPLATGFEHLLAPLRALDADELQELIDRGTELFESFQESFDMSWDDDWSDWSDGDDLWDDDDDDDWWDDDTDEDGLITEHDFEDLD